MHDREQAYDAHIAPLVSEIISLCKEHGIPMLASFQLTDGDDPMFCTTALPTAWMDDALRRALAEIRPRRSSMMMRIEVRDDDGEPVREEYVTIIGG